MFNMKIEEVYQDSEKIKIITTGAEFLIPKISKGKIICSQRLGKERVSCTLNLSTSLKYLLMEYKDEEKVIFYKTFPPIEGRCIIRVNSDSLLTIESSRPLKITYKGNFIPDYSAFVDSNFIYIDEYGGVGGYTLSSCPVSSGENFSKEGWKVTVLLKNGDKLLTSIFPPRKYDYSKSIKDEIVHYDYVRKPHPSQEEISKWSKWGNILVLHSSIWKGRYLRSGKIKERKNAVDSYTDAVWTSYKHIPLNKEKLLETIQLAHKYKMKIIPYIGGGEGISCRWEEFIDEMKRVLKEYSFDGLYFDGVPQNIEEAYWIMKNTRKLLANKILYVHQPSPIIGLSTTYSNNYFVYCPFIDTYADYILRAEHQDVFDLNYLRYTVSGFNISNSVGYLCIYDYTVEKLKSVIPDLLKIHVHLPYFTGYWTSAKHLIKERDFSDRQEEKLQELMHKEYFPVLRKIKDF